MMLLVGSLINGFTLNAQENIPTVIYNFIGYFILESSIIQLLYFMLTLFGLILFCVFNHIPELLVVGKAGLNTIETFAHLPLMIGSGQEQGLTEILI